MNKWKATDMCFWQVWNPDAGYQPEKRNFTLYAMIYKTPEGESIILSINIEEGFVFLEDEEKATQIFENEEEMRKFIEFGQVKFDQEIDMGKGTSFIYGYGGKMKCLPEYNNENIVYIPIVYPTDEKYDNPRYKEKVQWSLIGKGAIMISSKEKETYLAVIQRKNKPRDLTPFGKFIAQVAQTKAKQREIASLTTITMPKWLARNVGITTEEKEVTIQTTIEQETEKAVLIHLQEKPSWLPKSKITIA